MKNKIICLLLALIMVFSVFALTACGEDEEPGHVDDSGNADVLKDKWWEGITYKEQKLLFKMTKNSNREELASGCERYMAGEDASATGDLDEKVATRNAEACKNTKVTLTYSYFLDTTDFGWGECIDDINKEVLGGSKSAPDMYCNFLTDMLSTSLLGSFNNLYSRENGTNYMNIDAEGYMDDLMSSLTLSTSKIYVVASDYFLDLIRSFFVVPVNVALYNQVANMSGSGVTDLSGDGKVDINDLFVEVKNLGWTYDRIAEYTALVYKDDDGNGSENLADTVGFALSKDSGLSAAGLVYTSSVTIIHKDYQEATRDFKYYYPEKGDDLVALTNAIDKLFKTNGVISVDDAEGKSFQQISSLTGIRYRFSQNKVLFGGIVLLGSLEYQDYQNMKKGTGEGFGVVPAPLFRTTNPTTGEAEKYQTQIHVVGKGGAISFITKKFSACTAFLQYQSTHSTEILNEYYDYNLTYDIVPGLEGNVDMLKYIRSNVRTSFDKLYEDAIGFFYESQDPNSVKERWHSIIANDSFHCTRMAEQYAGLYEKKAKRLAELEEQYKKLPD